MRKTFRQHILSMNSKKGTSLVAGCLAFLISSQVFAAATDTLPEGIYSPSLRIGNMQGIDQKYDSSGGLWSLGDLHAIEFNSSTLQKFNADADILVRALNDIGSQTQQLGSNINFGTLVPDTKPVVNYYAPILARGITPKWTVGIGLPVINYQNHISFSVQNSNVAYYRQFSDLSPDLASALNTDLVKETYSVIQQRGYKPLTDRNETYLGDAQLASLYCFYEKGNISALYSATFNLPTGPKYDPDDLAALNVFGRTGLENRVTLSYLMGAHWEVAPFVSYMAYMPDHVTERVPTSPDDTLPDQSTREDVTRQLGGTAKIGGSLYYTLDDKWSFGTGLSYEQKSSDSYSGSEGHRYDLLSVDTDDNASRFSLQVNYSTVKSYFRKLSLLPGVITINYMDTIAGRNIERQTLEEIVLMMFF